MPKPLMSIAMIFRNDIRSIERCLKALQPLRDAAPCELVMADTGSTDGSREIAERYADVLFDFPWIDDFSAARNAVFDHCSGIWAFVLDTDEYLDEDVSELVTFLCNTDNVENPVGVVTVRNYDTYDMDGEYSDFLGTRILRMSTGIRYKGAIHEHFDMEGEINACSLPHTILHHDGYVAMYENNEQGKAKSERNAKLLREELKNDPENLALHLQLIEAVSNADSPDYVDLLRNAVRLVREKKPLWNKVGPSLLRYAVYAAEFRNLPEWDEWLHMAEEWFPDSLFTRIDVEYTAFVHCWNHDKDYTGALERGRRYLKALEDYRNGVDPLATMYGTFQTTKPSAECLAKVHMVCAYCTKNELEDALTLAQSIDLTRLNREQVVRLTAALQDIHCRTSLDTEPLVTRLWDMTSDEALPQDKRKMWTAGIAEAAGRMFVPQLLDAERSKLDFVRHSYTLYLPLRDRCELGLAAVVMEMRDPDEIEAALGKVESWDNFSIHALIYALRHGIRFPLPGKPLNLEEMDGLAVRMSIDKEYVMSLALDLSENLDRGNWQKLLWTWELVKAAVRVCAWDSSKQDGEQAMAVARAFVRMEHEFLPHCYAPEVLQAERLFFLPPMHRFGWYCAQAFEALDAGNTAGYVHLLRMGLESCHGMKPMVEFLLGQVAETDQKSRIAAAPPELVELAKQVQVMLARFDPNDPAVEELKNSPAYQQVAWLIEKPDKFAFGNFPQ